MTPRFIPFIGNVAAIRWSDEDIYSRTITEGMKLFVVPRTDPRADNGSSMRELLIVTSIICTVLSMIILVWIITRK